MLLALALCASTAHADVPHYDLDLLYHDGERIDWTGASSFGPGYKLAIRALARIGQLILAGQVIPRPGRLSDSAVV